MEHSEGVGQLDKGKGCSWISGLVYCGLTYSGPDCSSIEQTIYRSRTSAFRNQRQMEFQYGGGSG